MSFLPKDFPGYADVSVSRTWTEGIDPKIYQKKERWPKISIVTASFNQAYYIEDTIRSVLLQNYPNLEYIVIDGESTDGSVDIIKKYAQWITYWVSEKDQGQAHALNKGLKISTGNYFNYINSDDYLAHGALFNVGMLADNTIGIIAGRVYNFSEDKSSVIANYTGEIINGHLSIKEYFSLKSKFYFHQPGVWYNKKSIGPILFDQELNYCFDTKFILELLESNPKVVYTACLLVHFRLHNNSKTLKQAPRFNEEFKKIHNDYLKHQNFVIANIAKLSLERKEWMIWLTALQTDPTPKIAKIVKILKGIIARPLLRMNRFSFGRIKQILIK